MAKALTLGTVNLLGAFTDIAANGYTIQTTAEGTSWDNADAIDHEVDSWLQQGMLIMRDKYGNRPDMTVKVRITGADANKLALAEMALMLETGKPNLLTWTPPGVNAQPCVFEIIMSKLEHSIDDFGEIKAQPYRIFVLRMQAEPFVRAQDMVTVTKATPAGTQTINLVDDCTSFSGWAATISPAQVGGFPTLTSGASGGAVFLLAVTGSGGSPHATLEHLLLTRTGLSSGLTGTPYVRVDLTTSSNSSRDWSVTLAFKLNGVVVPVAVQEGNLYWLDTTGLGVGATLNTVVVDAAFINIGGAASARLAVNDVSKSNVLGTQGTNRQLSRILPIAGSAPTEGNLLIEDASNALGSVLVYTSPVLPGQIQPNIIGYRTSGGTSTSDATTVSGFSLSAPGTITLDVPASGLLAGGYEMLARVKTATATTETLNWSAAARVGSNTLPGGQSGSASFALGANAWTIVTLAKMNLPPRKLGNTGLVRIQLSNPLPLTLVIDEIWLFNMQVGRLSWVECGTSAPAAGGAANRLFLDAPTLANPNPAIYLGTQADRSDAYHAADEMKSFPVHEIDPSAVNVFTVTTNSVASVVTLSQYARFNTHVAA